LYSVELSQRTVKFLSKLDNHLNTRIRERLKKLSDNPVPSDAKFISREEGDKIFRYRIGDYRALYKVKEKEKIILVAKIDKRPRIYKRS
jgi:mRNA interferase RelE/StbE